VKIRRRLAAVFVLAVFAGWYGAGAAHADPSIAIDPRSGPPLTTIKVSGSGFCGAPCSPVSILVDNLHVDDNVAVDGSGNFSTFVQIPGGTSAGHTPVMATQSDAAGNPSTAQTDFNVTPNQPAPVQYPPPSSVQPPSGGPSTTAVTVPTTEEPTTTESSSSSTTPPSSSVSSSSATSSAPGSTQVAAGPSSSSAGSSGSNAGLIIGVVLAALAASAGVGWWIARRRAASADARSS